MEEYFISKKVQCPICSKQTEVSFIDPSLYELKINAAELLIEIFWKEDVLEHINPLEHLIQYCGNCTYADVVEGFLHSYKYPDNYYSAIRNHLKNNDVAHAHVNELKRFLLTQKNISILRHVWFHHAFYLNELIDEQAYYITKMSDLYLIYHQINKVVYPEDEEDCIDTAFSHLIVTAETKIQEFSESIRLIEEQLFIETEGYENLEGLFELHALININRQPMRDIQRFTTDLKIRLNKILFHGKISASVPLTTDYLPEYLKPFFNSYLKILAKHLTYKYKNYYAYNDDIERIDDAKIVYMILKKDIKEYLNEVFHTCLDIQQFSRRYIHKLNKINKTKTGAITVQEKEYYKAKYESVVAKTHFLKTEYEDIVQQVYKQKKEEMLKKMEKKNFFTHKAREDYLKDEGFADVLIRMLSEDHFE